MSASTTSLTVRRLIIVLLTMGGIYYTAPWPALQAVLNAFLVLGLLPEFPSPLVGATWAAAAGWVLEGTLRTYPHLGGTALANIIVALVAGWALIQWPPTHRRNFWFRLAALSALHSLLIHLAVRIACGPHPWGWGWLWTLLATPLWGTVAFRLHQPAHRR